MATLRTITEMPNELTSGLDMASPVEIVRLLRQTDAQIFSGYGGFPGLMDESTIRTISALARRAAKTVANPKGVVLMGGAGTSGRIGHFAARGYNREWGTEMDNHQAKFRYMMAGGDAALIQAYEGAEDDAAWGVRDLLEFSKGCDDVFYVGITCGMSAPYVGGQLEALLDGTVAGHAVLMAFSPTERARRLKVDGWDKTFGDVVDLLQTKSNATVLNPVFGPEPVTGSTRMKSGTGTRILLETIMRPAIGLAQGWLEDSELEGAVITMLADYREVMSDFYFNTERLGQLVDWGGAALRSGGRIMYVGGGGTAADGTPDENVSDAGLIGLVDASECPPTYGATFDDVRGFVCGGWKGMFPFGGPDLTEHGKHYRIAVTDFEKEMLPTLTENDLVVFLGKFPGRCMLTAKVAEKTSKTCVVTWHEDEGPSCASVCGLLIELAGEGELCGSGLIEIQVKLLANALTTGAHVLKGKVFGNRMVDLKISNNKLYHRTVGIVSDLMGVGESEATTAVLRAVFEKDELSAEDRTTAIVDVIERAKSVVKVVPKALLLATGKFTYGGACKALDENPMVRAVLASVK